MKFNTESREDYFRLMTDGGISVAVWIGADGPVVAVEYPVDPTASGASRENVAILVNGDKVADKHGEQPGIPPTDRE